MLIEFGFVLGHLSFSIQWISGGVAFSDAFGIPLPTVFRRIAAIFAKKSRICLRAQRRSKGPYQYLRVCEGLHQSCPMMPQAERIQLVPEKMRVKS